VGKFCNILIMARKKIGIDLDTTLNNLNDEWLDRYNLDYNDNLKQWDCWNVADCVKPECGKKIFNYLKEPNFFFKLSIRKNAVEVIDFLMEYFDIYIVTAYLPETCLDKVNWVKKFIPKINSENIIFINNKSLLDLDFLIDDGPHNIQTFNPLKTAIIYDMPYNHFLDYDAFQTWDRVSNWNEIKQLFEEKYIIKESELVSRDKLLTFLQQ